MQHQHSPASKKATVNRLSRAIGHLEAVKRMVTEDRDCSEVLIQLSAVKSAITGIEKAVLKEHLDHCIVEAVRQEDDQTIQNLKQAIDRLL